MEGITLQVPSLDPPFAILIDLCPFDFQAVGSFTVQVNNRPFSKMAAQNSNKLKLKTFTSTRKSTFTLVTLQSFSISGVISAEKM